MSWHPTEPGEIVATSVSITLFPDFMRIAPPPHIKLSIYFFLMLTCTMIYCSGMEYFRCGLTGQEQTILKTTGQEEEYCLIGDLFYIHAVSCICPSGVRFLLVLVFLTSLRLPCAYINLLLIFVALV